MKYVFAITALVVSVLMVVFAEFGDNGKTRIKTLEQDYMRISADVQELKRENDKLKAEIKAFQTDDTAVERTAREQLGMIKEDELIFQFER